MFINDEFKKYKVLAIFAVIEVVLDSTVHKARILQYVGIIINKIKLKMKAFTLMKGYLIKLPYLWDVPVLSLKMLMVLPNRL